MNDQNTQQNENTRPRGDQYNTNDLLITQIQVLNSLQREITGIHDKIRVWYIIFMIFVVLFIFGLILTVFGM